MKKLLFILLLVGVLIMLRPINAIVRDNVGNIIHRLSIVTGEVAKDNGDGSYNVYIAGEAKAYPRIFTLARNPDIEVGDTVRILYKNGDKNNPIIWPPVKPTVTRYHAFVLAYSKQIGGSWIYYLAIYDLEGNMLKKIAIDYTFGTYNQICLDPQGNVYDAQGGEKIRKYDKDLNLLLTQDIEKPTNWIYATNMGSDGYLYTLEVIASGFDIKKRSISDLTIQETINISTDPFTAFGGGICFDTNGNFYVWNDSDKYVEKYNNSGIEIASEYIDCVPVPCFGIVGATLYFGGATNPEGFYLPKDLSSHTIWEPDGAINYRLTVVDGTHIICSGWDASNDSVIAKYDRNRNLIWKKIIAGGDGNPFAIGAYNFAN